MFLAAILVTILLVVIAAASNAGAQSLRRELRKYEARNNYRIIDALRQRDPDIELYWAGRTEYGDIVRPLDDDTLYTMLLQDWKILHELQGECRHQVELITLLQNESTARTADHEDLKKVNSGLHTSCSEHKKKNRELQSEIERLNTELTRYQNQASYKCDNKQTDIDRLSKIVSDLRSERDALQSQLDAIADAKPLAEGDTVQHQLGGHTMIVTSINGATAHCEWVEKSEVKSGKFKVATLKRAKQAQPRFGGFSVGDIELTGIQLRPFDSLTINREAYRI